MRIAFYAPLKPPGHAVPSGDRRLARLLIQALTEAGHRVDLASRFKSRDALGEPERQIRLAALGERLALRYLRRVHSGKTARPDLWFTYHLYYKAPDWIGPHIAYELGIPYVVAEASLAGKRAGGKWDLGHRATVAALAQAAAVIGLNPADKEGVIPALADAGRWTDLKPFLDRAPFDRAHAIRDTTRAALARQHRIDPALPWLIVIAMMREDVKRESYHMLGAALRHCLDHPFHLLVAGDGKARADVAAALAPLGSRVTYLGAVDQDLVPEILAAADLFTWPAIGEAIGMALLEAQAAGLPVVAGQSGGISSIVARGATGLLTPPGDAEKFAAAVKALLDEPARRHAMGQEARRKIAAEHDLVQAAQRLDAVLTGLISRHS